VCDIQRLEHVVSTYYPGLFPAVKAGLALFAMMALEGRTKPRALIFEGLSGYGKSAAVQMFFPFEGGLLRDFAYRCDKFTPKSFVSHSAQTDRLALRRQVDLLPELENKVLLTKELAPIFRGREENLKENFAILIAVLDGQGFTSHSGVHGKRGYEKRMIFNWLGATTPLPPETHRLMYQLGTRLLFCDVPSIPLSDEELLAYAEREDSSNAEVECQEAVNSFLLGFFENYALNSIPADAITIPKELNSMIARWANFLTRARAGIKYEKEGKVWKPVAANPPEGPYKVIDAFKEFARAHALIDGRNEVVPDDLELVAHIAISSIPGHLRPIIRRLRCVGCVSSSEVERISFVSRPTARVYLEELALLGIVKLSKGSPQSNAPHSATLASDFRWLLRQP
jgi:hypothetical protein